MTSLTARAATGVGDTASKFYCDMSRKCAIMIFMKTQIRITEQSVTAACRQQYLLVRKQLCSQGAVYLCTGFVYIILEAWHKDL